MPNLTPNAMASNAIDRLPAVYYFKYEDIWRKAVDDTLVEICSVRQLSTGPESAPIADKQETKVVLHRGRWGDLTAEWSK